MAKLFISYRRDDSADICGRLDDKLAARFGREHVFKDVDSIPLGVDFRQILRDAVGQCGAMLVVIGRLWIDARDASGQRRLETHNDFVRIEVEDGLARGIPVIPVLVQGAAMPREDQLPATLAPLAYRNGLEVRGDPHFHRDADQLIEQLAPILVPTATPPPAPEHVPQPLAPLTLTLSATSAAPASRAAPVPTAEALPEHPPAISSVEPDREELFTAAETAILETPQLPDAGIEEAPTSLAAWLRRGKASLASQHLEEALTAFEEALAIDGNNALAWSGKALALKQLGRYEEAGFAARCAQLGAILARRRAEDN
jgi:hypothetical protein